MILFNFYSIIILFIFGFITDFLCLWRIRHLNYFKNIKFSPVYLLKMMLIIDLSNLLVSGLFFWLINSLAIQNSLSNKSILKNLLCKSFNMTTHLCIFLNQWINATISLERCAFIVSIRFNKVFFSVMRLKIGLFLCFCLTFALFCNYISMYGIRLDDNGGDMCFLLVDFISIYYNSIVYLEIVLEVLLPQSITLILIIGISVKLCHSYQRKTGLFSHYRQGQNIEMNLNRKHSEPNNVVQMTPVSHKYQIYFIYLCYVLCITDIGLDFPKNLSKFVHVITNSSYFESIVLEYMFIIFHLLKFCAKGVIVQIFLSLIK